PFSFIFSRLIGGVDIRTRGSRNVGATNVLRSLGWQVALVALLGDVAKGFIPAWLGYAQGGHILAATCGAAAVAGHCWPVFLRFKGGKGVATSAGAILFLMPKVIIPLVLIFILIIAIFRYVSLGSIIVAALLPVIALIMGEPRFYLVFSLILAVTVIARHHSNITKLRNGTEAKITERL
ncbi:MAG: glycerol-3-phosphate 1-O-acyltransferase PlsY, partial [Syntrophomonadaceae bacterium]